METVLLTLSLVINIGCAALMWRTYAKITKKPKGVALGKVLSIRKGNKK